MKKLLITIDGPAGAGKTTVSRQLAEQLGYTYIDTGALYRAIAYEALVNGISADDDDSLDQLCRGLVITFERSQTGLRLICNQVDITDHIRTPEITMLASAVSAKSAVRNYLLDVQRNMGKKKAVVFEGRDMGTVVFPEADVKFFLSASEDTRARRRYKELADSADITLGEVANDIKQRDQNDSTRELAPLKPAVDAIRIDSTDLSVQQVVNQMIAHIREL